MSDREYPLYTIKNNCLDCYKCVRSCPVKAIKIEDNSAQIIPELCIACGACYQVCPVKAKQPRNDLVRAKHLLNAGKDVYVSLAPSWITEFPGIRPEQMIAAIRRLGFKGVGETAVGAEAVSAAVAKILEQSSRGLYISTACPAVVEYINKYMPEMSPRLTPLSSPLLAHCRMMKERLGHDIEIVFVGPCIAKKLEADRHPDLLNLSLTFGDLRQWLKDAGVSLADIRTSVYDKFVMQKAEEGTAYPIEGGMVETIRPYKEAAAKTYMTQISGISNIKNELKNLDVENLDRPVFVECLACAGGCVSGPCVSVRGGGFAKRMEILKQADFSVSAGKRQPQTNIHETFAASEVVQKEFSEADIRRALNAIGKYNVEDELNCNGCGYDTCRNFACAMLRGKAEPEMCVSNMKHQAQRKANALLRCIPSPIAIVNSDLRILEYNDKFVEAFWQEEHAEQYARDDLRGASLRDFVGFTNLFSASIDLEQDIRKEHVRFRDRLYDVVVFNIDKKQIVGGIIQDVTTMEMKKEQIAERARDVIKKNLVTVQQIACTLGEHMAETEILLRSIAHDYAGGDDGGEQDNG